MLDGVELRIPICWAYYTLVLLDCFADIEKFFASFGKAAAEVKLAPQSVGVVKHSEWTVYRYVPELSIQPPALKAENIKARGGVAGLR